MFKNYFLLNRHVLEVNKLLQGYILLSVFTQEKDKLVLHFRKKSDSYFVEISSDSRLPFFICKKKYNRAKKNTLDFYKDYLPAELKSVEIAELDRIVKFYFEEMSICFMIRGNRTNVFLIDKHDNLLSFKKIDNQNEIVDEIKSLQFSSSYIVPEFDTEVEQMTSSLLRKMYPALGKEIIDELFRRKAENPALKLKVSLKEILNEVLTSSPRVYREDQTSMAEITFFSIEDIQYSLLKEFDIVNDALKYFISEIHKHEVKQISEKVITNKYKKKINQLEKKSSFLSQRIKQGCKEKEYMQLANLLLSNLDKIKPHSKKVELEDIYNLNNKIEIKLNPELLPHENVNYYFDKAKKERMEFDKAKEMLINLESEIKKLKVKFDESMHEMDNVKQNISNKSGSRVKSNTKSSSKLRFRRFILADKYQIFVGKDSTSNDKLTLKFAKPNDYWFHARSVSGSHVVLKWDKSFGEIQKSILEKAASIAAFYSKAKTSGLVPVSYTQKKYVIKKKGMEPGKVALLKEKVLIVKPEIPKECTLVTDED